VPELELPKFALKHGEMAIMHIIGFSTTFILLSLSLLHVYWALGGKSGFAAAIPTVDDQPFIKN
jgi:hypothetical protein